MSFGVFKPGGRTHTVRLTHRHGVRNCGYGNSS